MNTNSAFIGFNKSGKEILVYRIDDNKYIDLLSKDNSVYPTDEIELSTLIPYSKIIRTFKNKTKEDIVKKYNDDRTQKIDKNRIKVGTINSITNLYMYYDLCSGRDATWDEKFISRSLFIASRGKLQDVTDNQKYYIPDKIKWKQLKRGYIYATELKNTNNSKIILSDLPSNPEKKMVIELAYKLKNKK